MSTKLKTEKLAETRFGKHKTSISLIFGTITNKKA
jgi:hypothetical protein